MIALLFLLSDILYNSAASVRFATSYRGLIQGLLPMLFEHLNRMFVSIIGRMTAKNVEDRVKAVLYCWKEWSIFPINFLDGLEATFFRSIIEVEKLHSYFDDINDGNEVNVDDNALISLRRRAFTNGVTFFEESDEITITDNVFNAKRELVQLERKLMYVSLYNASKCEKDSAIDGEVYDIFEDFDADMETVHDEINCDRSSTYDDEDIDGVALDL